MVEKKLTERELIEGIFGSGLVSIENDCGFRYCGCDYCVCKTEKRLGNNVSTVKGYLSLEDRMKSDNNYYTFLLCDECINELYYGERR